jgi:hypothetical protein
MKVQDREENQQGLKGLEEKQQRPEATGLEEKQ